jgi:cation diffusion facilitator CzcD-associated flavoprotein CzcO
MRGTVGGMDMREVVVVGAGPAGVASALALKDRGLRPQVLDRADRVASSWHGRYDRLRLNTSRPISHLPGRRFPRGTTRFPSRDQLAAHIERHAHEDGIELNLGRAVDRIDPAGPRWRLTTSTGEVRAAQVVVATGFEGVPVIPEWDGRDAFEGRLLHAAGYRNPAPFQGSRALVVGPGCSGMEIAYDLAEGGAAKVWLAARTAPNIVLREGSGGLPNDLIGMALMRFPPRFADALARMDRRAELGDLTAYGLPIPGEGVFSRLHRIGAGPAIVDREVIAAIEAGRIEVVRGVEALGAAEARLADGGRIDPDVIICATGYRRGLEPLVGHLAVLDGSGLPRVRGKRPAAPGLRFVGFHSRPGALRYMGGEARRVARAIERDLERADRRR